MKKRKITIGLRNHLINNRCNNHRIDHIDLCRYSRHLGNTLRIAVCLRLRLRNLHICRCDIDFSPLHHRLSGHRGRTRPRRNYLKNDHIWLEWKL